ncbi:hypothetical protein D9619_001461 [Psilocybe cf. subviscida]|uniref:Uncharacterized protein n=1 Tax=Psilocybe cf. subviscida TaxID=2480587 RepID=A0A8H5F2K7_9AGAR|nr:hypothetical protein D9619_001461 [Psilocybe cf. subviscida]
MAATGSQNQYPPAANTNQAPLKTIPSDFRFKTIGQAPGLLRRITTPDPEVPVSPSPSPSPSSPASPKFDSSQLLIPNNQSQMKPKASLLERMIGPSAAAAPQVPEAGPSQQILATRPTRANAPLEANQSTTTTSQRRSAPRKAPSPGDNSAASTALPKLDTAPQVPLPDPAMDVDTPANGGPGSGQAPPSIPTPENAAEQNGAASSSTGRRIDQPSGSQQPSQYAIVRNRLEGISEALLSFPTVNTDEADRLLNLAKAQSTAALQFANHAQETTKKALECLQEAMKAVGNCIVAAQESSTRTDAAMAAVAALTGPAFKEERERFIAPIQVELDDCRQAMDRMEELLQKQRQMRAQRQRQASAQAAPAVTSTTAPTVESAVALVVAPAVAPTVPPATESPAAVPVAPPGSSHGSTFAAQPNAAGMEPQVARSRSLYVGEQSAVRNGKQKEERKDLTFDEHIKQLEEDSKAYQKEQQRQYQAWLDERVAGMREGNSTAVAQNVQATNIGCSSQPQQTADGQLDNDRMMMDDEDEVKHPREDIRSAVPNEVRQRMIKERLEVERQAAERRRSEEDDKPVEGSNVTEENLLQHEHEESRRRQAIQRQQIQEEKQRAAADEAKNINARRSLLKRTSPIETSQAPVQFKDEPTSPAIEMLAEPTTTKSAGQTGKVISGNVPLGAGNDCPESKKTVRAIADVDNDRSIRRIDTKSRTPSQSKPNNVSPIARLHPLPDDIDYATKHTRQVTVLDRNQPCAIPNPVTLPAGLPPRPQFLTHQVPLTSQNLAAAHAASIPPPQVSTLSPTDQHASQPVINSQETQIVVKREPDDDVDIKSAQWNAAAPMTPDSLPPDNCTSHSGPSHQVKREGSINIPMLSLPSPPPPTAPPAASEQVFPQMFGSRQGAGDTAHPEGLVKTQTTHGASGTQFRGGFNVFNTEGPGQHTHLRGPTSSEPLLPPVSQPQRPPDALRVPPSVPATQPPSVRPEHPPSVPSLIVTEFDTAARTDSIPGQGVGQFVPESHSSGSLNSDRSNRNWSGAQRRAGGGHYSPSPPPPRRSRSRSRSRSSRPLPPRGDHYSPRRNLSPGHGYSGGYSRFSADRSRSRGPRSATNSRNPSPNPYTTIAYRQPPLGPANPGRKRSYAGDMPQGPPPRRPRYDESPDDTMQAGSSRSYVPEQDMRDERSAIANRAPRTPEYRPRPLEERLQPSAPYDAPRNNRGRQPNYEPNNRYNNRRPLPEDSEDRYYHDRSPPLNSDHRPPPPNKEIPPPANANSGAPRPNLLSRLDSSDATNDADYNSYFHQQPTNNHHNNYQNNRGPRRGRGTGPTTPRGGKYSLINRIEG